MPVVYHSTPSQEFESLGITASHLCPAYPIPDPQLCEICACVMQEIAAAVKLEYGASRNGYALEVYLALQRLQTAAAGETVVEAEEVQSLLDGLKVSSSCMCDHV